MLVPARSLVCCVYFANTVGAMTVIVMLPAERGKRKRTTNIKYFTSPWRSDNFTNHLHNQHKAKWEIYRGLSAEEQSSFFIREENPEAIAMRSFVQPEATIKARIIAKQKCNYLIDAEIFGFRIYSVYLRIFRELTLYIYSSNKFRNLPNCLQCRIASKEKSVSLCELGSFVQLMIEKSDSTLAVPGITLAMPPQ